MVKTKETITNILKFKDLLFASTSIIVVLLNLWLTTKLLPLVQRLDKLEVKAQEIQINVDRVERSCFDIKSELREDIKYIRSRVDNFK